MRQILLQKRKKGPHLWAVLKFLVYFIILLNPVPTKDH